MNEFEVEFELLFILISSCSFGATKSPSDTIHSRIKVLKSAQITLGNQQTELYLPLLENKRVAVVGNQTSTIGKTHLVDTLLALGIQVKKVFAPEHGFRGVADNGEHVANETDKKSGASDYFLVWFEFKTNSRAAR